MKPFLLLGLVLASIIPRPWDREKFGGPDGALTHRMFDMRSLVLTEKELVDGLADRQLFLIAGQPGAIAARYDATPAGLASLNRDLAAKLATNDCQLRLFQSARISQDSFPLSPFRPATNSAFSGVDALQAGDVIMCCPPDLRPARTNAFEPGVSYGLLKYQIRDLRLAVVGAADLASYIASNRVVCLYSGHRLEAKYYQCNRLAMEQLKKDTVLERRDSGGQWRLIKANRIVHHARRERGDDLRNAFLAEIDSAEPGDLLIHCQRD
jgi:hypothetical protein